MRTLTFLALAFAALLLAPAAARADCGNHLLDAAAPRYQRIETIPLTPENVDLRNNAARRVVAVRALRNASNTCPGDPPPLQYATSALAELWSDALDIQTSLAYVNAITAGKLDVPADCAPSLMAQLRGHAAQAWAQDTQETNVSAAERAALMRHRYATHVLALWRDLAKNIGFELAPIGSAGEDYSRQYIEASYEGTPPADAPSCGPDLR